MEKLDLKKELKQYYKASAKNIDVVDIPSFNYLTIEGKGNPNESSEFEEAIGALYAVAYTIKFGAKKNVGMTDFVVMPLEGLWWTPDMADFSLDRKDLWHWKLMILLPEFISKDFFAEQQEAAFKKKGLDKIRELKFEEYTEGLSMQKLYIGPYSEEHETIKIMHEFARNSGYKLRGKHHEIYLGDPRKTAPEKLKTILRQPIEKI